MLQPYQKGLWNHSTARGDTVRMKYFSWEVTVTCELAPICKFVTFIMYYIVQHEPQIVSYFCILDISFSFTFPFSFIILSSSFSQTIYRTRHPNHEPMNRLTDLQRSCKFINTKNCWHSALILTFCRIIEIICFWKLFNHNHWTN